MNGKAPATFEQGLPSSALPPPLPPRGSGVKQQQQRPQPVIQDDLFNELDSALAEAEATSSMLFKKKSPGEKKPITPLAPALQGALSKLSRQDDNSRFFASDENVPEQLQGFIETPSFASLNHASASNASNTLPPPLPPRPRGGEKKSSELPPLPQKTTGKEQMADVNEKPFLSTSSSAFVQNKKENVLESAFQQQELQQQQQQQQQQRQKQEEMQRQQQQQQQQPQQLELQQRQQHEIQRRQQEQQERERQEQLQREQLANQQQASLTQTSAVVLNEVYEAQVQHAAYMAMQAQIESGVTFSSDSEQQQAYYQYYAYYTQYYQQMQQQQEQHAEAEQQNYTNLQYDTQETQAIITSLQTRAEQSEAALQAARQELEQTKHTLEATSASASSQAVEITGLKKELAILKAREELNKKELLAAQQKGSSGTISGTVRLSQLICG